MFPLHLAAERATFLETLQKLWESTGLDQADWGFSNGLDQSIWGLFLMMGIACFLVYLALVKKFEPLLLLPIAFGMFIINIPGAHDLLYMDPIEEVVNNLGEITTNSEPGGLFFYLAKGVELVIFPPIIFLGIGAMTDFGPMIANPKTILLGAAAQLGIFITFLAALALPMFDELQSAAIAIIGGADGPTAIYVATKLAPDMLGIIAIAAYSYMALVPVIQPPIMRLLTTKKERAIKMEQLRTVSKLEKIIYPLIVTGLVGIMLPPALPLLGMLMLGNLLRESGVVERLVKTASNELINIVTIFLGIVVGTKAYATVFLKLESLLVIVLGLFAFSVGTAGGVLFGKLMCKMTGGKVNPLIGSAGVSAVPMAARISQKVGQESDPTNYLLMHAMGPNVAGVIGSAIAAGVLLALFGVV